MCSIHKGLDPIRHCANRVRACNLSTREVETGESEAEVNPRVWGKVKAIPDCLKNKTEGLLCVLRVAPALIATGLSWLCMSQPVWPAPSSGFSPVIHWAQNLPISQCLPSAGGEPSQGTGSATDMGSSKSLLFRVWFRRLYNSGFQPVSGDPFTGPTTTLSQGSSKITL